MRVTDAMVDRAAPWTQGSRHVARCALEAAVEGVDVSGPAAVEAMARILAERDARIAELEAKLAKARQWATRGEDLPLADLDAILDDKGG
jgi:hypothetical protein